MDQRIIIGLLVAFIVGCLAQSDPYFGCAQGCRDGTREGLNYTNIAICAGVYEGYVAGPSAQSLCAETWHVCSQTRDRPLMKQIQFDEAEAITGCYSLDAAHDFNTCRPCSGNINEDDMAGVGGNCPSPRTINQARGLGSCFTGGRVDICCSGYLSSNGCQFNVGITTGVVCCANNATDPCNHGDCPKMCCKHGSCDYATGVCTCDPGYSGDDCCTHCPDLGCADCLAEPTCGWCKNAQVCTELASASCFDITFDKTGCPPAPKKAGVDQTPVIVGSVVGTIGALAIGTAIAAFILYRRFSAPQYAEFWDNFKLDGIHSNPLYKGNVAMGTSPLYEE